MQLKLKHYQIGEGFPKGALSRRAVATVSGIPDCAEYSQY
jgi:hypothetical protein